MTDWTLSIVMIVPASLRDIGNRLSCALGHDTLPGNTFSVPLSPTGSEPATHYGCRTAAQQSFADLLMAAGQGVLPEIDWTEYGLTVEDIGAVLAGLITDVRPAEDEDGHFDAAATAHGLARVMADGG